VEFVPFITSNCGPFLEWLCVMRCKDCRSSLSEFESAGYNVPSYHTDSEFMAPDAQRQERRDFVLSSLNVAIEASNLAKELCSITPAKPVFGSLSVILTMIKVDRTASSLGWPVLMSVQPSAGD
jgi:hypothetical protein